MIGPTRLFNILAMILTIYCFLRPEVIGAVIITAFLMAVRDQRKEDQLNNLSSQIIDVQRDNQDHDDRINDLEFGMRQLKGEPMILYPMIARKEGTYIVCHLKIENHCVKEMVYLNNGSFVTEKPDFEMCLANCVIDHKIFKFEDLTCKYSVYHFHDQDPFVYIGRNACQ